jgi:hypothetical protein
MGQTAALGGIRKTSFLHAQNIFDSVINRAWTSKPTTVSRGRMEKVYGVDGEVRSSFKL